jgi:TonB family protein
MPRTEPDAGPRLLLEDYGKASQRWLQAYASARDAYKRPPSSGSGSATDIHVLIEPQASRTQRWLERFARDKADFGPYGGPPPNLTAAETPDLELLIEDYDSGPRFVQQLAGIIGKNGAPAHARRAAGHVASVPTAKPSPARKAAPARRNAEDDLDLKLTPEAEDDLPRGRRQRAQASSLAIHLVVIVILLVQPRIAPPPPAEDLSGMQTVTLIAPPAAELAEIIRRSPNQQQSTELVEPAEAARPAVVLPSAPAPAPEPIQVPEPPKIEVQPKQEPLTPTPKLEIEESPPTELAAARSPAPGMTRQGENRPRLRPNELPVLNAPKTTNEPNLPADRQTATGLGQDGELKLGSLRLNARPDEVIEAATQNLITSGGTQIVGDGVHSSGTGGALPPSPGNRGSTLELLSDPKGVDFRPYLIQVLAAVRRNWYAVIPESARLGMARGRVAIQFIVSKEGMVPKLVIADSSGTAHLDRAAVAGISASVPFQPLPPEFNGKEIRLQFVFLYNTQR